MRRFNHTQLPTANDFWLGNSFYPAGSMVTIDRPHAGCLLPQEPFYTKTGWACFTNSYLVPAGECIEVAIPQSPDPAVEPPCFATVTGECNPCLVVSVDKEPAIPTAEAPVLDGSAGGGYSLGQPFYIGESKVIYICNKGSEDACALVNFKD